MARRTPEQADKTTIEGGASGAPGEHGNIPTSAITGQTQTAVVSSTQSALPKKPVYVPVRRYVVEEAHRLVMNGLLVVLSKGKQIDETQYDCERLKRENVQLKELPLLPDPFAAKASDPAEA